MKLSSDLRACSDYPDIQKVEVTRKCASILVETPGTVGAGSTEGGGNSGFQAVNLAVQFGARRITLVGFDYRIDRGVHWHGRHPEGLNNPREHNMTSWRRAMDKAAAEFGALRVEVVNASTVSTLTAYPLAEGVRCS